MKEYREIYGAGGYDPSKPNNNLISREEIEVPEPELTPEERIAELEDALAIIASELLQ